MSKYRNSADYTPNSLQIELVQGCNRHCSFCGTQGMENKIHFTTKEVLKRQLELISEAEYKPRIQLIGHGEPTLHPKFFTCVKMIRKALPKHYTQIYTNGYLVRKDLNNLCKIFEAGVNDITLDEYKDSKFDDEEIQQILQDFEEETGKHVNFVRMGKGVPLYGPKTHTKYRLLIVPAIDESEIAISRSLNNHCGAGMPPNQKLVDRPCTRIFRELIFRWDGWADLCCADYRGQYPVVNVLDESIETLDDIWRHPRLEAARRILYHKHRCFFPCNVCDLLPIREGLLPDYKGQQEMEEPTEEDFAIVKEKHKPLSKMIARSWEPEHITSRKHLNLEEE